MNISEKIEMLRKHNGISLTHLNHAIGAYRGKITDVKNGKASFTKSEIAILAEKLGTSADYLLGNTDDPAPVGQPAASVPVYTESEQNVIILFRSMSLAAQTEWVNYGNYLLQNPANRSIASNQTQIVKKNLA